MALTVVEAITDEDFTRESSEKVPFICAIISMRLCCF